MIIENEFLRIQIKNIGAELGSLFNKESQTELLWQGNAEFWGGQAPILFPIVGMLKEGKFIYNNKTYELPRHGLARRSKDWKLEKISETSIKCILEANEETLKVYPFNFRLEIKYTLKGQQLEIAHKVKNEGKEKMPFSIGGHPAFNCTVNDTISYTDYALEFEKQENSNRHFLNDEGLFDGKTALVLDNTNKLQLTDTLFDEDALVFQDLKSQEISLIGPNGKILEVSYANFKTIGIWAAPKAPFVCIEPWIGYSDTSESTQNLFDKQGSKILETQEVFEESYHIKVV